MTTRRRNPTTGRYPLSDKNRAFKKVVAQRRAEVAEAAKLQRRANIAALKAVMTKALAAEKAARAAERAAQQPAQPRAEAAQGPDEPTTAAPEGDAPGEPDSGAAASR